MNTSVTKLSDIKRRDKNGHIYTINAEVVKKVLKKKESYINQVNVYIQILIYILWMMKTGK